MTTATVLHVLSQRPSLTGSGVTLDSIVTEADRSGWSQHAVVGCPASDPQPSVGTLPAERVHPLRFGDRPLDFPLPGMSDVMPYRSTRFSAMSSDQISRYRTAWKGHLRSVVENTRPTLIHSHHVWIVSSLIKEIAPAVPVVTHCHATGLRQMELCRHLADDVREGCARNDRFLVLHAEHADELEQQLQVSPERISVVGAGYRQDIFHSAGRQVAGNRIVYAGKYSTAKGVPCLLDAFELVRTLRPDAELHIAGSGAGAEAEAIARRLEATEGVTVHGRLDQSQLAELLRTARLFVLPSFYEGVPLVLVEAAACGCGIVSTDLPGIRQEIEPTLGPALVAIPLPRLRSVDQPDDADLPGFADRMARAIISSLSLETAITPRLMTTIEARFSWSAVFRRIESRWRRALDGKAQ